MKSASKDKDYALLEREIQNEEHEKLLRRLRRTEPFFRQFDCWADVVAFMRRGKSKDPEKDRVLCPILRAHRKDGDPRWRTILLLIHWPGLKSLHKQRHEWDDNLEDLWENIVLVFLGVLRRIDPEKRDFRLVSKVINDTAHRLHDKYTRIWKSRCEFPNDPALVEYLAGGVEGIDFPGIERREKQDAEIRGIKKYLDAGLINETDFHLLVGTRVYGKTIRQYASEAGYSFEAMKKRRQRAEARIRRFGMQN